LELLTANQIGWFNQGRYFLPGAVGLPLLGAHVLARRAITAVQVRSVTRLLAGVLLPVQLICVPYTMARWQSGLTSLNPLAGSWHPPYGSVLPLVLAVLATITLYLTYHHASRDLPETRERPLAAPRERPLAVG